MSFLEEFTPAAAGAGERTYQSHALPLEGSLVSLSALPFDRLFLASYRPSTRVPRVRHLYAELSGQRAAPGEACTFGCNEVHSLFGGTQMRMLSRARIFRQEQSERKFRPQ